MFEQQVLHVLLSNYIELLVTPIYLFNIIQRFVETFQKSINLLPDS